MNVNDQDNTDYYAIGPYLSTIRGLDLPTTAEHRQYIINQLLIAIKDYYVHLPIKRAAFTIDPVQELTLLLNKQDSDYEGLSFFQQLLSIINRLRDRHTVITLPLPWKNLVAYIPILIEHYMDGASPKYIISKKLYGYKNDALEPGTTLTHWNGVPIDSYLARNLASTSQGSNIFAAKELALANLTIRPLAYSIPPDEDWVTLSCITPSGKPQTWVFPWKYFAQPIQTDTSNQSTKGQAHALTNGLDSRMLHVNKCKRNFFQRKDSPLKKADLYQDLTPVDDYLLYGTLTTASGKVGYLRFYSFEVGNLSAFIRKIVSVLKQLPQDRLIVDIRGNPGGLIPAGESLAQLLCQHPISTSPVAFRNTSSTAKLGKLNGFTLWERSLDLANVTGEVFSQHFSLTDVASLTDYRYPGKTALIIDALCYSTCDFLSADFKDNKIGPIVGTSGRTGAGGANVWPFDTLVQFAMQAGDSRLAPLPFGMGLNIAMRRSIRTEQSAGLPVEDLGVEPDYIHHLTYDDLLYRNVDLLNFTADLLKQSSP